MRLFANLLIIITLFCAPLQSVAQTNGGSVEITEISVSGNQRVSPSTVLAYLPIKVGDKIETDALNIAIERLFATKLFSDVSVSIDGSILRIDLAENPIVNRVNIEGNDVLSDERLLAELDIQPRRIYSQQLAIEGTQKLLDFYRLSGRYAAVIEPKIIRLENNRVDLIFEVDEGPLIKISRIKFSGNQNFSDRALRQVISSRQERWWAFLASNDKYDENRLNFDVRLLRQFYLNRGYADISVKRVQGGLLPNRSGFVITFEIEEGPQYTLNNIDIVSEIDGADLETLRAEINLEQGDVYDVRLLEEGLLNITNALGTLGYAFVNVEPNVTTNPEAGTLDIDISIGSAQKNYVERINIINNSRTLDSVIRREMALIEGDAFNSLKLESSVRNIRNLGYFRNTDVRTIQGSSPEQSVIEIDVEEQSTGDLSLGLGYSSLDKTSLTFGINERNFLGTGRKATFSTSLSDTSTDIRIGLTEPYFLGRDLRASFEVFNDKTESGTTTVENTGFDLGVGFSAANDVYHRINYSLATAKTSESASSKATSKSGENGENRLSSSVQYVVGVDKLDNRFDPTSGYLVELSETYSGLAGEVTYLRSQVRASYFKPFMFNRLIFGLRGRAGYIDGLGDPITRSNRFTLGGRSVRGFAGGGIGPVDTGTKSAVGGNQFYTGSIEAVSDLGFSKDLGLRWTVFTDFGSLYKVDDATGITGANDNKLRQSLGFGFYWDTAIGPLSFTWTDAISSAKHDKTKRFQFSIGTRF